MMSCLVEKNVDGWKNKTKLQDRKERRKKCQESGPSLVGLHINNTLNVKILDNAYGCDPRIKFFKEKEKEEKEAQKRAKQEVAKEEALKKEMVFIFSVLIALNIFF